MALTPEQLAELQRLKQMYAPLVEAQRRRDQADANAQKMGRSDVPTTLAQARKDTVTEAANQLKERLAARLRPGVGVHREGVCVCLPVQSSTHIRTHTSIIPTRTVHTDITTLLIVHIITTRHIRHTSLTLITALLRLA
mgnify:CR=1 FL=1